MQGGLTHGARAIQSSTPGAGPPSSEHAGFQPAHEDERSETIAALIAKAEELYEQRRYREAIALCKGLLARGHMVAVMTMILEGCEGAVRRRRLLRATAAIALLALCVGGLVLYRYLAGVRFEPPPDAVLQVMERQVQEFSVRMGLGRHRLLEYTWTLLDGENKPVDKPESACLTLGKNEPWRCAYGPGDDAVKAADGGQPLTRFVAVRGVDAWGREELAARWQIEVLNVPRPPEIYSSSTEPSPLKQISIASGQTREFRVHAKDGDGGIDLTGEWLTAEDGKPVATGPAWAYRPDYAALAGALAGHPPGAPILHPVLCRVSNRYGDPLTQTIKWNVRIVAVNRPPQIVEVRPDLLATARIKAGVALDLTAYVHDADQDDTLDFLWELVTPQPREGGAAQPPSGVTASKPAGVKAQPKAAVPHGWSPDSGPLDSAQVLRERDSRVLSRATKCKLFFSPHMAVKQKEMRLVFTATDSCGAKAERTWRLILEKAAP